MYEIIDKIREGSSGCYKYYYYIKTKYGICKINCNAWKRSQNPTINTALNKTEYFVNQAKEIHNGEYCYKDTVYIDTKTKVVINCKIHGPFMQSPCNHLNNKSKCPKCSVVLKPQYVLGDFEKLLQKAERIHNNFYSYEKYTYLGTTKKSIITCPIHGDFLQNFNAHISAGQGCPSCALETKGWNKSKFIKACQKNNGTGIFYIIKCFNESESFYKLGFTSRSIKSRYYSAKAMPYNFTVVQEINDLAENIWDLELILKRYIKCKNLLYKPLKPFAGDCTECFLL